MSSRGDSYFINLTSPPFWGGGAVFTEAGWCQPPDKNVLIWHQPASIGICFPALFSFAQILWYTIVYNEISLFDMLSNLASICMIFVDSQYTTASKQ